MRLTVSELILETAIKEAGDVCDVRLDKAFAEDLLEILREQKPIKPTVSVDTWICSKCGHTLESQELIDDKENPQVLVHEQYEYCPYCGKKVKWDAETST